MNKKRQKAFLWVVLLIALTALMNPLAVAAASNPGKQVQLSWVSFVPPFLLEARLFRAGFVDRINNMNVDLNVKFRGGPEVIAPYDLGAAVQKGILDIGTVPVG